ncbi:MAG: right-handed parallel beta-helix repeat-containing protein [Planctomycetota bacterium]|jgi:hypothetical protein|nr:right-handed parallel beta-helix repeat-containing protein [Planctomycetota bacterium]
MKPTHRAILVFATASLLSAQDYHVNPAGSDAADGLSPETAVATISQAARIAQAGDRVIINSGIYRETVRPSHSGTADAPLVFTAAPGARVVISGADPISGWTRSADGSYVAAMPGDFFTSTINQADQVFIAGVMIHEARWPNYGNDLSLPAKATIDAYGGKDADGHFTIARFTDAELVSLAGSDLQGAMIHLQPNAMDQGWGWTLSGTVTGIADNELTLRTTNQSGKDGGKGEYAVGARYHLFGHRALLDAPGEWFHDRASGQLILRPLTDAAPTQVEAKRRDWGFDLSERSHVTVTGIRFFACSLTTDAKAGGDGIGYHGDGSARYPWRPRGFVAPSSSVVVADCHFRYLNHFTDVSGHFFLQWGQNTGVVLAGEDHRIEHCIIERTAGNGLQLSGRRHRALGNLIRDVDYATVDCAGIQTGIQTMAEDFEIAYNSIERCARSGMSLRGLTNSRPGSGITRIHHNLVQDWLLQDSDGGAFYAISQDGGFTRIDHNRFIGRSDPSATPKGGMFYGAYFDYSKGFILDHNLITNCATPIQVTREFDPKGEKRNDLIIVHNTGIGNDAPWSRPFNQSLGRGSLVQANLLKVAAFTKPDGKPENHWPAYGEECIARNNAIYGNQVGAYWTKAKAFNPLDILLADPLLENDGSFAPQAVSPLVDAAEPTTAIQRLGIDVTIPADPVIGAAADIGAIERGAPRWAVGANEAVRTRSW